MRSVAKDRKSTRLNSSHTEIYTLSLHDALPISRCCKEGESSNNGKMAHFSYSSLTVTHRPHHEERRERSEEHTSELQSHRDLHSFPTRRSSDLPMLQGGRKQ